MPMPKGKVVVERIERHCQVCAGAFFVTPGYLATKQRQRGNRACLYCSTSCQHASLTAPIIDGIKKCSKCNLAKPLDAFTILHGVARHHCKLCAAESMREHRAKHPEQRDARLAAKRAWDEVNREHVAESNRRYKAAHAPELSKKQKEQRAGPGREKFLERGRRSYQRQVESGRSQAYYKANKEKFLERERQAWRKHPERRMDKDARRRAQKYATRVEKVERLAIITRDASTCYLCKTVLETRKVAIDHVVPLARGGTHTADNLRVACKSCNSRKHKKLLAELNWSESEGWLPIPRSVDPRE